MPGRGVSGMALQTMIYSSSKLKSNIQFKVILFLAAICLFNLVSHAVSAEPKGNASKSYSEIFKEARAAMKPCEDYTFVKPEEVQDDEAPMRATLKDRNNNSIVIEGAYLTFTGCVDIKGDGRTEAVIYDYNRYCGGRPCSFTYVYTSDGHNLRLMGPHIVGDFGEDVAFKDLRHDGKMELLTYVRWAYWGGLDYWSSPLLPEILCYRENDFKDCTKEFPKILEREIDESLKVPKHDETEDNLDKNELQEIKGQALKYLAIHEIMGNEKEGWKGVRKLFPSAYQWLKEEWNKDDKMGGETTAGKKVSPSPITTDRPVAVERKAPEKVMQVTGEVVAINIERMSLVIKGKRGEVFISIDSDTAVKIGEVQVPAVENKKLADLKRGDKITIRYATINSKNVARTIILPVVNSH